jgi:hypothetical protein
LRESIPVETILKAYMDETVEEDVIEEVKEQIIEEPIPQQQQQFGGEQSSQTQSQSQTQLQSQLDQQQSKLSFNDIDYVRSEDGNIDSINAPKSIDRLEQISEMRAQQRRQDMEDDDNVKLKISDQAFNLDSLDVHNIEEPKIDLLPDLLLDDIEVLE